MNTTIKRTLSVFLAALLLCALLPTGVLADESTVATTIRLGETSGTVSVTNASGKAVSISQNMRLYNGYEISSGKDSSAYLTLDETKAVKLDASSKAEVKKSGRQLEVGLKTGQLFFGVTQPLTTAESLNIRTATMVSGIRGSFGWVNGYAVGMMHGHAIVTCINPVTGEVRVTELNSGEIVYYAYGAAEAAMTSLMDLTGSDPDLLEIDFIKRKMTNEDVPAIVIGEMRADPSLQEPVIRDVPNLDVPRLLASYEAVLEAERTAAEEREAELLELLEEQQSSAKELQYYYHRQEDEEDERTTNVIIGGGSANDNRDP